MKCMLCGETHSARQTFSELFFIQMRKEQVCPDCMMSFKRIPAQHCTRCYKADSQEVCPDCKKWEEKGVIIRHCSLFQYKDAMKSYFSRYKFEGDYLLRHAFATELRQALMNYKGYTLVPIPVSKEREEERGFDQVTGLLEAAGCAYAELLGKVDSPKQSEKTRQERLLAKQTFYLLENITIPSKILLIDDIYTTGATLELAKQAILKAGKKEIKTFSLAR
ncbi:ComF family protein [Streptococcus gallolyticus]|uniref:ComF family protein n=1 Tax=Streptococcus hepaticus TaxID=3349163 RepID=UPI001C94F808|nr:ComF family protein [Streptococcus gallolyticus]MBY5041957.1 ComF family protein [Streptococcus gallolyticus]